MKAHSDEAEADLLAYRLRYTDADDKGSSLIYFGASCMMLAVIFSFMLGLVGTEGV